MRFIDDLRTMEQVVIEAAAPCRKGQDGPGPGEGASEAPDAATAPGLRPRRGLGRARAAAQVGNGVREERGRRR
jgi:hypothetical protein